MYGSLSGKDAIIHLVATGREGPHIESDAEEKDNFILDLSQGTKCLYVPFTHSTSIY